MLARLPEGRPKDAAAVLDELGRLGPVAAGVPLTPRPQSSSKVAATARGTAPARQLARMSPWPIVAAAALAAGITAAVLLLWGSHGAPARAGSGAQAARAADCAYDRCDPFETPNDVRQIVPKVRAHVTGIERGAVLVEFGVREPIRTATLGPETDLSFTFRSTRRDKSAIVGVLTHGKLNLRWYDAKVLQLPIGDPRCPLSRVLAAARARGAPEGPVSVTLLELATEPVWTVSAMSPKPVYVMVNDSTCEVRALY